MLKPKEPTTNQDPGLTKQTAAFSPVTTKIPNKFFVIKLDLSNLMIFKKIWQQIKPNVLKYFNFKDLAGKIFNLFSKLPNTKKFDSDKLNPNTVSSKIVASWEKKINSLITEDTESSQMDQPIVIQELNSTVRTNPEIVENATSTPDFIPSNSFNDQTTANYPIDNSAISNANPSNDTSTSTLPDNLPSSAVSNRRTDSNSS